MWKDHKIIGIGLANWKVAYEKEYILPEVKEHDLTMPHNVFMIFLSQTGIIGILDYFIFDWNDDFSCKKDSKWIR